MTTSEPFYLFSDESGQDGTCNIGAIAVLSGSKSNTKELNDKLVQTLGEKSEVKFSKIKSRRDKEAARLMLDEGFRFVKSNKVKIDVVIWNKLDSRCRIPNRDDEANLARMYYHLLLHTIKKWGTNIEKWMFFPDQLSSIDWEDDVIKYLERTSYNRRDSLQIELFETIQELKYPSIPVDKELDSKKWPIIQLADLYAGLARTTRENIEKYSLWHSQKEEENQPTLFSQAHLASKASISSSLEHKFEVIHYFYQNSIKYTSSLLFCNTIGFKTPNPRSNLNFWHYTPQGSYDKAPQKVK